MEEKILNIGIVVFCVIIFGLVVMRLSGMKFKLPQAKKVEEKIEAIEEMEGKVLRVWVGFVILVSINALFFYIIPEENWWEVSSWIARAATGAAFASWMKYSYFSSKSQWGKANSFKFLAWIVTIMALIFIGISMSGGKRKNLETQKDDRIVQKEISDYRPGFGFKLTETAIPYSKEGEDDWSWGLKIFWPHSYEWRVVDELSFERSWDDVRFHVQKGNGDKTLFFQAKTNVSMKVELYGNSRKAPWQIVKKRPEIKSHKKHPGKHTEKSKKPVTEEKEEKGRAYGTTGGVRYVQPGKKSTDPAEEKKRSDYREYVQSILKSKRMGSGVQPGLPEKKSGYERQYEYQKKYQEKPKITQKTEEKISKKKERSGGIKIIQRNPESPPVGFRKLGNLWAPSKNKDEWSGKLNMCCGPAKYRFRCADKQERSVVLAEITFKSGEKMTVNGYELKILELNSGDKIRIRSKGLSAIQVIVFGNEYAKFDVVNRPKQREMTPEELFRELEQH